MAPTAELEKASIDEAFMDLTPMVLARLLAAHPHLGSVPPDAPDGLDSALPPPPPIDWSKAGNIIPIETPGKPEDADEEPEVPDTWQDWALCLGAEIMAEVREEVWRRLHYTCSAGIAHSKAMAKVGASLIPLTPDLLGVEEAHGADRAPAGGDAGVPARHGLHGREWLAARWLR